MNKKVIISVGVIVLLALGAGGFMLKSATTTNTTNTDSNSSETGAMKSLKDLLGLGSAQACSFEGGTVYVSNGKMRGDFTTNAAQGTMSSHMIVDGQTSYIWIDGQSTGFKMTFDAAAQQEAQESVKNNIDINKQSNYNCKAWSADLGVFTLPKDVTFTDFSALTVPSTTGAGTFNQCAACDAAPTSSRAACKTALGCK